MSIKNVLYVYVVLRNLNYVFRLVNNCLSCGRVVCVQEGSGPCLFCGKLVCTKEEKEILSRNSRKSEKLEQKLMSIPSNFSIKGQSCFMVLYSTVDCI